MPNHRAADQVVMSALSRKFSWSAHNCVTFSSEFVKAFHGYDPLGNEGRPADLRGAIRQVRAYGSLSDAVTAKLGAPVPVSMAGYGDVVLLPGTQGVGDSLGVCIGPSVLVPSEAGLARLPLSSATRAWKTSPNSR